MTLEMDRLWAEIDSGRKKPVVHEWAAPGGAALDGVTPQGAELEGAAPGGAALKGAGPQRMKIPQNILSGIQKAVVEFDMLQPGDRVLVGLSGGKDSTLLLHALAAFVRHLPWRVELGAIHIDLGFAPEGEADYSILVESAACAGVSLRVERQDMSNDILHNQEQNPCSRCAYWRRAMIHNYARKSGYGKVAFAHHLDDAAETYLMGLLYSGQLGTFMPTTYLDRTEVTVIRPFAYIRERDIVGAGKKAGIKIMPSACPLDGVTQRTKVKGLIRDLCKDHPLVFDHIVSGMREGKRQNLWPAPLERKDLRQKHLKFWQPQEEQGAQAAQVVQTALAQEERQ